MEQQNEYEDSIEKFKNNGPTQMINQLGNRGPSGPSGPNVPTTEQMEMMQKQKMAQQQAMIQQQAQQQAMMQQHAKQQAMMQQAQQANRQTNQKESLTFLEKLKKLKSNDTLQEIFIISILFILLSTDSYKDYLCKLPFVSTNTNGLNTAGLLISAVLISVIFVIIRTLFIS